MILTEYLQNAVRSQTSQRATKKYPHIWEGQKKKEKKREREKGVRTGLAPWEGAVKEDRFLHTGKATHWQRDQLGQRGNFRASEELAATSLQKTNWGKTARSVGAIMHTPARDTGQVRWAGTGCRGSGFGNQILREYWGWP